MSELPKRLVPVKKEPEPVTKKPEIQRVKGIYHEERKNVFIWMLSILIVVLITKIWSISLCKNRFYRKTGGNNEGKEKIRQTNRRNLAYPER